MTTANDYNLKPVSGNAPSNCFKSDKTCCKFMVVLWYIYGNKVKQFDDKILGRAKRAAYIPMTGDENG